jgi:electron transport complex protein RnfE
MSLVDGLGMGIGFTLALLLISGIREILGSGMVFGHSVMKGLDPALVIGMPPGALLVIGLLLGFFNCIKGRGK